MKITKKTIKASAETTFEEFDSVKELLSNLDGHVYSYINDYVIAYVVLKNNDIEASKIIFVHTNKEENYCHIDYEEDIEDKDVTK